MPRITIKDIARLAGVSVSTVSLVLSKRGYVSDKTREKVEKVIARYDYRPRQTARYLATGQTGNIGFIISDFHLSGTEFFYSRILLGAELEARKKDYYILLTTVGTSFDPAVDKPRFLRSQDVDAIIIAGSVPNELIYYVHKLMIPYVIVDYKHPKIKSNLILIENHEGAFQAVRHLIDHGHRRIAFVGGSLYHSSIQERFLGYLAALKEAGLKEAAEDDSLRCLVEEETSSQVGFSGICTLLGQSVDFDAVVCANDTTAIGCLNALRERKIRVPDEVAVVGFDDNKYAAETAPTLTTVHVPKLEMGIQAVRLIFDYIEHPQSGPQTRIISTDLLVRESTNGTLTGTGKKE